MCHTMEDMKSKMLTVRVPDEIVDRLNALEKHAKRIPEMQTYSQPANLSILTRIALVRGLASLESEVKNGRG